MPAQRNLDPSQNDRINPKFEILTQLFYRDLIVNCAARHGRLSSEHMSA